MTMYWYWCAETEKQFDWQSFSYINTLLVIDEMLPVQVGDEL